MRLDETHEVEVLAFGPLTFVFFEEEGFEGFVGAHCLELDLGGQGTTRQEAMEDLQRAVETFVSYHLDHGEPIPARRASPELANLQDREYLQLLVVRHRCEKEASTHRHVVFAQPPSEFTPALAMR